MKKKILALSLCVALLAVAVVGGTLAYFTDFTETKENVFTVGNVDIELTEPNWDSTGVEDAPQVYPGESLDKDPTVANVGANPCFVRVKVENLDQFGEKGDIVLLNSNWQEGLNEGWVDGEDGYFYWTKPLVVEGTEEDSWNANYNLVSTTVPVFSQIKMPTGLTGDEDTQPINVTAYAVQAQGAKAPNWAAVNGMTLAEIKAWFTTCGMDEVDGGNDSQD